MENSIVKIQNKDLLVGSWDLSQGFEMRHRELRDLIKKNRTKLEKYGEIKSYSLSADNELLENIHDEKFVANNDENGSKIKRKRGGQVEGLLINQDQYICLITILPNKEKTLEFKFRLADEFIKMRKVLIRLTVQKQNAEWIEKREGGKIERRLETDAIKEFIEYATAQGSKNAKHYYQQISKMENQSLVNLEILQQKFDNVRDMLDGFDLTSLQMADKIVAVALREGMKLEMFYKEIYILARDRVEAFSITIGKIPFRLINKNK